MTRIDRVQDFRCTDHREEIIELPKLADGECGPYRACFREHKDETGVHPFVSLEVLDPNANPCWNVICSMPIADLEHVARAFARLRDGIPSERDPDIEREEDWIDPW